VNKIEVEGRSSFEETLIIEI